ncbi:MAG: hypothetical protein R3C49_23065 [Planctomycetaceae bacterium]
MQRVPFSLLCKVLTMSCVLRCLGIVVTVCAIGCSGGGLPEGDTGTVTGKVSYNSQPVPEGSTVIFHQVGGAGLVGIGTTDSTGGYRLLMRDGEAVLAGKYNVSVTAAVDVPTLDQDELMKLEKPPEIPKSPLPEKFASPETSGLSFDVKAGENTIDVTLAD